ncbi:MAG: protein-disulfide reductase DsbD domain-containing protein, partial [Pseudomonadota bacterium]
MVLRRLILFAWLALGLFPVGLVAQGALPQTLVTVQFLPGWQTDSGARMSGLHLKLAPGWKTYWRSPGDAGIPPDFSWRGSENLRAVKIHWPAPSVYSSYGLRTVGYDGEVILPISVVPRNASQPVRLRA